MSLLPIVRITEFLEDTLTGGTTRPMLVIGEDGNKYVLKIFSKKDASQRSYTVAEVIANLLAKEFDLFVPDAVFMTVDPQLIQILEHQQPNIFEKLKEKEVGSIQFGSIYQDGVPLYSPAKNKMNLDLIELETILAFDILIANHDRRSSKPNILFGPDRFILIDHEKAFEGLTKQFTDVQNGIVPYFFKEHLFFKQIHKTSVKNIHHVPFETFEEYFRNLSFERLKLNINFLIQHGYNEEECLNWLEYLQNQKENCRNFVTLLRKKIRE